MMPEDLPLNPRSNEVKPSEVHKYVRKLKTFLGRDALAKAQDDLDKELMHHGRLYQYWVEQHRPWLFAFRLYDTITANGIYTPPQWPVTIQKLVGDGLMIASLHWGMPEDVRVKYRKDLLTCQHGDFMFEISTAWHYYLEGFDIQWYPLGHKNARSIALVLEVSISMSNDPVVFRCHGPRKTPRQLRDYIYSALKDKVNMQLSPE
jgi:hypothetical protein